MSDSEDNDKMLPPLIAESPLQGRIDHHAQRVRWLHQLIKMQRLFHVSAGGAGLPQEQEDVTMAPRDVVHPRLLNEVDVCTLWGELPPGECTSDAFQSTCVTPQSAQSNLATTAGCTPHSGSLDVTAKLSPRSRVVSASPKSQIQSEMPAMTKQNVMPGTSGMPVYSANSQAHKPLHDRSPFGVTSTAGQLNDASSDTEAKTTRGSPEALSKKSLPRRPDPMALPGLNSHQTPAKCELTHAWLDWHHSVLDLSTNSANYPEPNSSAVPSGSSSQKELRKSVVTAPELRARRHSPCFSQDTLSTNHTHLERISDQFESPYTWSESIPFPSFNVDSDQITCDDIETILTSENVEESLQECHEGGGEIAESQVKLERVDTEYLPPRNLHSDAQAVASESKNSSPREQPAFTQVSPHKTPFSESVSKLFASQETSLCATTATPSVLETLAKEQSLNHSSSNSREEQRQDRGEQETMPEEITDASSVNFKVRPPPDKKCPVCEDVVSGYHYGMYSCESCKGFFKRTIHSKRFEKLRCASGGTCVITLKSRKLCASCRFQKCLSLGMKFEAIRSNRQRGGRSLYNGSSEQRRLSKLEEEKHSQSKSSPPKKRKRRESTSCKQTVKTAKSANTSKQSNKTSTDTLSQQPSKAEAPQQQEHSKLEPELPQAVPVPKMIKELLDKEDDFMQQSFRDCCICILREEKNLIVTLSHIINHKMLPLIQWVKGLPLYRELTVEDQISLLHRSVLNLLCLNLIFYCLDNMGRLLMPQNQVIDLNYFSVSKFNQLVPKITHIGHQLHSNGLNMRMFVCLKLILLLNPDTPMLQNRQQVRSYQESIQNTFFAFMSKVEPKNRRLAGNLMLSLAAIERVCQQVTLETVCHLEVVDEMFRHCTEISMEKQWIQCRFL